MRAEARGSREPGELKDLWNLDSPEKAGAGVAPGVDFGPTGKQAARFGDASSEEDAREAAEARS